MIINHNMAALNTLNKMNTNQTAAQGSLAKLSSGMRINKAGDDAAGLAISEKMRAQIRGLDQASANAQDGVSLIQTAEGGLNEVHSILQRMRELSDQSANGTNTADDRTAIQSEVGQLKSEIDRIGNTTEFNTQKLLNGNLQTGGIVAGENQTTSAVISKLTSAKLSSAGAISATGAAANLTYANADTLTVDGHAVTVNWDTLLTASQKTQLQAADSATGQTLNDIRDILGNAVNAAIDQYNSTNPAGATVGHMDYFLDSSNKMQFQSSTKGVKSEVFLSIGAATSVGAILLSDNAGAASTDFKGSSTYSGTNIGATDLLTFQINGQNIQHSMGAAQTGGTTALSSLANDLQTALNAGISSMNNTAGKASTDTGYIRDVKVLSGDDGRLQIVSESGTVTFSEIPGKSTIGDLGLTNAQTSSAGNGGMTFQIGANKGQTLNFGIADMRTSALGIAGIDVSTAANAQLALSSLDGAIKTVSGQRANLGAVQNRLEHTVNNLSTSSENATAAESRIRDVDMAKEMMAFSKNNILNQAAQAMMAQANQLPQGVLQLLR